MTSKNNDEINLKELFYTVAEYKWIFLIIFFAFLIIGGAISSSFLLQYQFNAALNLPKTNNQALNYVIDSNIRINQAMPDLYKFKNITFSYYAPNFNIAVQAHKKDFDTFKKMVYTGQINLNNQMKQIIANYLSQAPEKNINNSQPYPSIRLVSEPTLSLLPNQISIFSWLKLFMVLGICFGLIGVYLYKELSKLYTTL